MRWTWTILTAALAVALMATPAFARSAPPVPVIERPADDPHHQRETAVTLSGTAAPASLVGLYEDGDTPLQQQLAADGTWTFALDATEGPHTYRVRAEDPLDPSAFATRTVVVDLTAPAAPEVEAPAGVLVRRATAIAGTAEPAADVVVYDGDGVLGRATADDAGAWSVAAQLDRGAHALSAEAVDAAGNHSERSAPVTVQVASVTITSDRTPFAFTATPAVPLTCRLVVLNGGGNDAACASSYDVPDLPPGTYRFVVFPAGGDEALGDSRVFVVDAPPPPPLLDVAAPLLAPAPRVVELPAPVPALRRTVVLRPVGGTVLVRRPGAASALALTSSQAVPLGATIDAEHGRVRLTAARRGTRPPQRAEFSGGVFVVKQKRSVVDLRLTGGRRCATRRLTGEGRGNFRISGRYATATARGTTWLVRDSCKGTRVRVKQGVVAVRDKVRHRTVLVHPRKPYLAKRRR